LQKNRVQASDEHQRAACYWQLTFSVIDLPFKQSKRAHPCHRLSADAFRYAGRASAHACGGLCRSRSSSINLNACRHIECLSNFNVVLNSPAQIAAFGISPQR
jgi:hypothetical protein